MHRVAEWLGDMFENIVELLGAVTGLAFGCLLFFHFFITFGGLSQWGMCQVAPGPVSGFAYLLFMASPLLAMGVQVILYRMDLSPLHIVVFAGLVAAIGAYDIWMFSAHLDRNADRSLPDSVRLEQFVDSSFCKFTRSVLPSKI